MRIPAFALIIALTAAPLLASDWPAGFERYESLLLEKPARIEAFTQMWRYAQATGREAELKQRWEALAMGRNAAAYRILLGFIGEFENDFEAAHAQFRKAVELAPNDAEAHFFLGEMEAMRRMPEARATLEKTIEMEMSPDLRGLVAETLARDHLFSQRLDEGAAVLDRAIASTKDSEGWLRLTRIRAESARDQGRLAEFITQLEESAPDPLGGSRLAQAYLVARDYAQAAAVVEAERRKRPENALLRLQALNIARAGGRTSEVIRVLRDEAKLAPSAKNWSELFRALVTIDSASETREILASEGAALFDEPRDWRSLIPSLWHLDLARPIAAALAKSVGDENWEVSLLRAELLIAEKDWTPAEEALWSILDPKRDTQPLAASFPAWAARPAPPWQLAALPGAILEERVRRLSEYLNETPPAFKPRIAMNLGRTIPPVETLSDARDLAILYLGMIAAENQRQPAFVGRLRNAVAGWPRAERLLAWLIVQNPEEALAEIEGVTGEARDPRLDRFCRGCLMNIGPLRERADLAGGLLEKFPEASLDLPVLTTYANRGEAYRKSNQAFREGRFEDARKIYDETTEGFLQSRLPEAERERVACAMSFALMLPELKGNAGQEAEGAALAVRSVLPRERLNRWPTAGEGLQSLFPTETPAQYYRFFERGVGNPPRLADLPESMRDKLIYPPATFFSWEQTGVLWTVFGQTRAKNGADKDAPVWPLLKAQLDARAGEVSGDSRLLLRVATAYLSWWNQEPEDAISRMRQLLSETGDPAVQLALAAMLGKQDDGREALPVLDAMKLPTPGYARTVKTWRMALAAKLHDATTATAAARELAEGPWETADLRLAISQLGIFGCPEAAAFLHPRLIAESLREENFDAMIPALRDLESPSTRSEAVSLAKRILAPIPCPRSPQLNAARTAAFQTLQNLGEREAYTAQRSAECKDAPQSLDAWLRLAEASKGDDAVAAWKKVIELEPEHRSAARELLKSAKAGSEEQRQIFEKLLAVEPDDVFEQHNDMFFQNYEAAKLIPKLADLIGKAPFPSAGWRRSSSNAVAWHNLAERFVAKGRLARAVAEREAALIVLRKAVTTLDPVPTDLRRMMLTQLVALNRTDEAGKELIECLAPGTSTSPLLFAWRPPARNEEPRTTIDTSLIRMAQSLGVAPELRERVKQAAAKDATARVAWIFLRVASREPEALLEIPGLVSQVSPRSADISWVLPLAADLSTWPEAADSCRKLLLAYDSAMAQAQRYPMGTRLEVVRLLALAGWKEDSLRRARLALETARKNPGLVENRPAPRAIAKIALAAGDTQLLSDCSRIFTDFLASQAKARAYIDPAEPIAFAGALMEANRMDEAKTILDTVRTMSASQNDSRFVTQARPLEMEMGLRKGDWQLATPVVWLDQDRTTLEQAALVWDLGMLVNSGNSAQQTVVRGEAASSLDGRLVVELFNGEDAESMQPIARLEKAGSRGLWQGHLPFPSGFLRVVVSQGDQLLFGDAFRICAGQNLLSAHDLKEITQFLPAGDAKWIKGGPSIDDEYLTFHPADLTAMNANAAPLARRVAVKPGRDYQLGGWLRVTGSRSVRLGWRCLDRDGKQVATGQFYTNSVGERFWIRCEHSFSWPRNDAQGERIPINTAFIEPTIQGDGGFDLAGLYIVELLPATLPSEP